MPLRSAGYGMQDPGLLANGLLSGSLANQLGAAGLAELGLTQGLAAMPQAPQNLPANLGGLGGMPGHGVDALAAVRRQPLPVETNVFRLPQDAQWASEVLSILPDTVSRYQCYGLAPVLGVGPWERRGIIHPRGAHDVKLFVRLLWSRALASWGCAARA